MFLIEIYDIRKITCVECCAFDRGWFGTAVFISSIQISYHTTSNVTCWWRVEQTWYPGCRSRMGVHNCIIKGFVSSFAICCNQGYLNFLYSLTKLYCIAWHAYCSSISFRSGFNANPLLHTSETLGEKLEAMNFALPISNYERGGMVVRAHASRAEGLRFESDSMLWLECSLTAHPAANGYPTGTLGR